MLSRQDISIYLKVVLLLLGHSYGRKHTQQCLAYHYDSNDQNRSHNNNSNSNDHLPPPPASTTRSSHSKIAADIVWEFNHDLEGWAQSTITEMNAEVYHMGGEMRIDILNSRPDHDHYDYDHNKRTNSRSAHVDSPLMNLPIAERETLALRYRFIGPSRYGKIRLRGGSHEPYVAKHGLDDWGNDDNDNNDHGFLNVYFPIHGDGLWHIGYAEIEKGNDIFQALNGTMTQIRLWPGCQLDKETTFESSVAPQKGNWFHIDWIRLVRAPIINRVTGCAGEKYFDNKSEINDAEYNIKAKKSTINGMLHQYRTEWIRRKTEHRYSSTYNCIHRGHEEITLEGHNFGLGGVNGSGAPAHIYIDNQPCTYVKHDLLFPQHKLTCLTPALRRDYLNNSHYDKSLIEVRNGKLTGLMDRSMYLEYASPPPKPMNISLSNFASRSIDISWQPSGSIWDHMTYTGYIIKWREENAETASWPHHVITGNITTTTIRGLRANTTYMFGISGLNEDQNEELWFRIDLYGRRERIDGALEGPMATISGHTLKYDIEFQRFDANSTQSHGPEIKSASNGPTGIVSGEGHYGLVLIGHANIENCNASSFCCDTFDQVLGICKDETSFTCMGTKSLPPESHIDRNDAGSLNLKLPGFGKIVERYNDSSSPSYFRDLFKSPCGPTLRLTASESRQVGAAWYPRQVEVGEGFETNFTFRISNPSLRCNNMDDVYTHCRARGGDGFAFVIQGEGLNALGKNGKAMGYGGINNSLAIEFDTYFNYEENDPYENHISIQTRGWRNAISENHFYSLGQTNYVPDLTDGTIRIRIKYEPFFDLSHLSKPSFTTTPHMSTFFQNDMDGKGSGSGSGSSDWSYFGLGLLHVYCENLNDPVLTVPLHLSKTLQLNRGQAWVGFTASTGDDTFQVHDILHFTFSSLRLDS